MRSEPRRDLLGSYGLPESDVGFADYVKLVLDGMRASRRSMASRSGFAGCIRTRGSNVTARTGSCTGTRTACTGPLEGWWLDAGLPTVMYDDDALIVDANEAARRLLGSPLIGHHWQEFVTPGGTGRVAEFLPIIRRAGVVNSRFRMPREDGSLVEFDSHTEVHGRRFRTVMRLRP